MDVGCLSVYLPMDRRQALATNHPLPDRAEGAALLADVAGFTRLADSLVASLGPHRGAEELIHLLNAVHDALIAQVHRYGGSVVGFSGDGFACWFDRDPGLRATACGLALHQALRPLASAGEPVAVSLKVAVVAGPVRRFLVGDPRVQCLDLLAGATLDRLARAEQEATQGELLVGPEVVQHLGPRLDLAGWRAGLGLVAGLAGEVPPIPWPALDDTALPLDAVHPFLLPPVYERLMAGQGEFLAELRPAVALFLRFGGLDYDRDGQAGVRLDAYVRWVQGVLGRYGGHLLQLTSGEKGNYLYASFGALTVHEDDAERAVAAALELQRLPPELDFIQKVQIGLSRGRVRAGAYGSQTRRTYGALGDEVNVAARLMQAAPPGEVRCSQRIYEAVKESWTFEALPPVQVKGKAGPLPVYRPLQRREGRRARPAGALVGRQAEMATLARSLAEAKSGRRVVLLEGEAGIGKSRLLAELARLAGERNVAWLEGAGQSIEQGTPYRAWRDLLAAYFALGDRMSLGERQHRVREWVAGVDPALVERAPLLNDVLSLDLPETGLTRGFDPKLRRESLTWLLVDLLRDAVQRHPLALVLEDAHWLDSLSWELALAVGRALYDRPLLLVLALRPMEEPLPAAYTALAGLAGVETVCLAAMPPEETVALAAARLGLPAEALPAEVADLVRERAGGNPFFAEELAHALQDSGTLAVEAGACTLAADLETLRAQVPDTVEGVVLSRIDRLPAEEQLTLKVAAVVGRSFLYRTVRDVHPRQVIEDLLRAHLDDLAHRDLTPLEALEPELTYLFKHVITQQVAYDTLLFAQRRELHRAVAGWYERLYAGNLGPYYPLLVHHWHGAEDAPQERRYAKLAGEQAAAQYANAEAVAYLSRALALTPDDDLAGRYALLLAREKVCDLQGDRAAQSQDLQALEELADALDDGRLRGEVALRRAGYAEAIGDYLASSLAAQDVICLAQVTQDVCLEAAGYRRWGCALWRQGDLKDARIWLETALALARRHSLRQVEAAGLRELGTINAQLADYDHAREHYEQALSILREIGDREGEGSVLNNFGNVSRLQGDYAQAQTYLEQALHIRREMGDRRREGNALGNLGMLHQNQGHYTRARAYFGQALGIEREVGDRSGEANTLNELGVIAQILGDYAGAQIDLEQSLHIFREIGDRLGESTAIDSLGIHCLHQGNYVLARDYFEQALAIAQELGARFAEGNALGNLAMTLANLGDYAAAWAHATQSLHTCREIGNRKGEVTALEQLSLIYHRQGDHQTALAHALKALHLAQGSGAPSAQEWAFAYLGNALMGLGRLAEAAEAYNQAMAIQRERGRHHLAVESLANLSRVSLAQNDLSQAQAQTEKILAYLELNSLLGTDEQLGVYLACYQVLHAAQDSRAEAVLNSAYTLVQEQAAKIEDEALRRSFLENVAVNREIVAAYRATQEVP
jgi:class 3 adenylate cyclase/Tfp pilus assembly protein PilF